MREHSKGGKKNGWKMVTVGHIVGCCNGAGCCICLCLCLNANTGPSPSA